MPSQKLRPVQKSAPGLYQVRSNDDPRLTLTYLTSRSNLLPNPFKLDFLKSFFEYC